MGHRFEEIADHPAFTEGYQGGLKEMLKRAKHNLEYAEVSDPVEFARLQERVKVLRWVIEAYPLALTGAGLPLDHREDGQETETGYEPGEENPPFAD